MSSGLIADRTVEVGRPGRWAEFTLAHGWASGEGEEPPESVAVWFYGIREDVDPQRLEAYAALGVTASRWRTREEILRRSRAVHTERERQQPGMWSWADCVMHVSGHPRLVEVLAR